MSNVFLKQSKFWNPGNNFLRNIISRTLSLQLSKGFCGFLYAHWEKSSNCLSKGWGPLGTMQLLTGKTLLTCINPIILKT